MTTEEGFEYACSIIRDAPPGGLVLWDSMPCIAGCPWYHINKRHPGAREKHDKQLAVFHALLSNLKRLAAYMVPFNHVPAKEWPKDCAL